MKRARSEKKSVKKAKKKRKMQQKTRKEIKNKIRGVSGLGSQRQTNWTRTLSLNRN